MSVTKQYSLILLREQWWYCGADEGSVMLCARKVIMGLALASH